MKELNVKQLPDNFFTTIGKEWMLVTAGSKEHFNTMTASWGCVGWLWNKPVAVIFIRPERYTHESLSKMKRSRSLSLATKRKCARHTTFAVPALEGILTRWH